MKIGPDTTPTTAISGSNAETIIVRGHDLVQDLIGTVSFTDHVWLLVCGTLPSPEQRRVLDATLVAIAEHGLVPSVQAARMTLAAAPEALQGAVAAGLLGCGSVILGSAEAAGRFQSQVLDAAGGNDGDLDAAITSTVRAYRAEKRAIPGYGHPLHKDGDPRALRLFTLAEQASLAGPHMEVARRAEHLLPDLVGKPLKMNVSAAIPAVLLDAGFPLLAVKGVPLLARTASLVAHLLEEQRHPIGFRMSHAASGAIRYDGPAPDGFVADEN
ncbi:citryl-CoA lyase [Nitrospirillum bahiense]|uniref:citrate synthase (unknown stereospecificity) n=1 Tax=Nitrospirillum amazonense TaxID=28077 RepID=A0A560GCU4_9PROT|nr:citryl-CoA lyase [Nitrospirillum amazonense]TWB31736.1 citrate synthase [Nitrospirillum amazonense]